ncbi:MAG: GNAT family N-acetyltransferase [Chloroflexota bacterium]|nr:GNAT family N-acetyltransferase [Chloroflexota bacterium]
MVNEGITVRRATVTDVRDLVRLRRVMFEAMSFDDPVQLDAADAASAAYFAEAIPAGKFHGWLAVTSAGVAVSSGGVVIDQHPPGPGNLSGQVGYIMNVVTIPPYRRQGIARRIMRVMLKWLADQGIQRVTLHATEMGRSLYAALGFADSNEMRLTLE